MTTTRYMLRYVRPGIGPVVGTIHSAIGRYVSDANARRYFARILRADHWPAGQYLIETFPESDYSGRYDRQVGYLYKTA
jgi:hypothetical protein